KRDAKGGTSALTGKRLGPAAVHSGDRGRDREAETASAARSGARRIDPEETVEDVLEMLLGDARSRVLHVDAPLAGGRREPYDDLRALRCVAASVREQIAHRLADAELVCAHLAVALGDEQDGPARVEQGIVGDQLGEHDREV